MLGVIDGTAGGILGSNETDDTLTGSAENNVFFVGRGTDTINGRGGQDVLNVDGEALEWNFTTLADGSVVMTHPTWGTNTLTNVESIFFARSGTTLSIADAIAATAGLPTLRVDSDTVLNGTPGNDTLQDAVGLLGLYGGVGNDTYQGVAGNFSQVNYDGIRSEFTITENNDGSITVFHPIWGTDTLVDINALVFTGSEPGVDGVRSGDFEQVLADDIVFDPEPTPEPTPEPLPEPIPVETPIDSGTATNGADVINGTSGKDVISGLRGNDTINGGNGADTLNGNRGADTINGGNGKDLINGGNGADTLSGNRGADIINGGNGADTLSGNRGADTINGGNGVDWLAGGNGTDTLNGGNGEDTLIGGNGADTLNGGAGNDLLIGGNGADIFVFSGDAGFNRIEDFSGNDHIDLTAYDFHDFSEVNIVEQNGTAFIFLDENTSIELKGVEASDLTADAFIL